MIINTKPSKKALDALYSKAVAVEYGNPNYYEPKPRPKRNPRRKKAVVRTNPANNEAKILDLDTENMTRIEIADSMGCTPQTVARLLTKFGLPSKRGYKGLHYGDKIRAIESIEHKTAKEIAAIVGC